MSKRDEFQSTHPVWGGTVVFTASAFGAYISIHPPRVGWDINISVIIFFFINFNPPTPCGVGLRLERPAVELRYFNPPTPCGVGRGC